MVDLGILGRGLRRREKNVDEEQEDKEGNGGREERTAPSKEAGREMKERNGTTPPNLTIQGFGNDF